MIINNNALIFPKHPSLGPTQHSDSDSHPCNPATPLGRGRTSFCAKLVPALAECGMMVIAGAVSMQSAMYVVWLILEAPCVYKGSHTDPFEEGDRPLFW